MSAGTVSVSSDDAAAAATVDLEALGMAGDPEVANSRSFVGAVGRGAGAGGSGG